MLTMAKNILVVDDEADALETMKMLLESEGYEVSAASDGHHALDLIAKQHFDMILLDIKMPGLSGHELRKLILEKITYHVPILFVTIVPKHEVDVKLVDGFIQKPFEREAFLAEVKRVFLIAEAKGEKKE